MTALKGFISWARPWITTDKLKTSEDTILKQHNLPLLEYTEAGLAKLSE
jgi:hypothetical protein